jgi:hypothetical protein
MAISRVMLMAMVVMPSIRVPPVVMVGLGIPHTDQHQDHSGRTAQ